MDSKTVPLTSRNSETSQPLQSFPISKNRTNVATTDVVIAGSTAAMEMSQFRTCSMVYKAPHYGLQQLSIDSTKTWNDYIVI